MKAEVRLTISEIFYSIQGESSYAGYPCLFFRLAGCNLRCSYCDARYTYEEPGHGLTIDALLAEAAKHPNALIEITGGEPLLQEAIYTFMDQLLAAGRTVLLETNGSIELNRVPAAVVKIMDLKCPGSTMHERMDLRNLDLLQPHDEVKFVVGSRLDYEWARRVMEEHGLSERVKVLIAPVAGSLPPAELADWLLADELCARLQIQLHTLLWPAKKRGF